MPSPGGEPLRFRRLFSSRRQTPIWCFHGLRIPVGQTEKSPLAKSKRGYGDPERTRTVDLQRDRLAC